MKVLGVPCSGSCMSNHFVFINSVHCIHSCSKLCIVTFLIKIYGKIFQKRIYTCLCMYMCVSKSFICVKIISKQFINTFPYIQP